MEAHACSGSTVFILGAGASWHYSYPTGEELVHKVIAKAERLRDIFETARRSDCGLPLKFMSRDNEGSQLKLSIRERWRRRIDACHKLERRLAASNPLLIDHFLALNRDLWDVGRMMIAWSILDCEVDPDHKDAPPVRTRDWLRFVRHQLMLGCADSRELVDNKVTFVTFNYDVSLELALMEGLTANTFFIETPAGPVKSFTDGPLRAREGFGKSNQSISRESSRLRTAGLRLPSSSANAEAAT